MKVEISFNGTTWTDYSAFVKDQFTVTHRVASNDFHCATNLFNFVLIYDETLFIALRAMISKAYVKYYDDEDVIQFSGYFMPSTSYGYDGVLDCQTCTIEAQDFTELLRVPVGSVEDDDVAWQDYAILDNDNPSTSIVHALFTKIGLDTDLIASDVSIPATVGAFASSSYEDDALDMLDTLLYEYGYVCNWNKEGKFEPIQWIVPSGTAYDHTFTGADITLEINENVSVSEQEGNQVVWYGLGTETATRVYTEDLPWDEDGDFEGYAVIHGYNYPPEASVIDDTTGDYQKVYQEYNDTGIRYKTAGRYVEEEYFMDFALSKADFSEILITTNHVCYDRYDIGLDRDVAEFFNKRARIRYRNTSGTTKLLYYMHIDADVIYKKSQQKVKIQLVSDSNKLSSYETRFVFDIDTADSLCSAQAIIMQSGNRTYKFQSEESVEEGSYVRILPGNGVDATGIIIEKVYDGYTGIYTYEVAGFTAVYTSPTSREVIRNDRAFTKSFTQSYNLADWAGEAAITASGIATTAYDTALVASGLAIMASGVAGSAQTLAESSAKRYLGAFTTDPTEETIEIENIVAGDYYLKSDATPKVFRRYDGDSWADVNPNTDPLFSSYVGAALQDLMALTLSVDDQTVGGFTFITNLVAKNLFASNIQVLTSGSIRGGDRFTTNGTVDDADAAGFYLGADGVLKAADGEFTGELSAFSGEGVDRRKLSLSKSALRWSNAPIGEEETEVARINRIGVGSDIILMDGLFSFLNEQPISSEKSLSSSSLIPSLVQRKNGEIWCLYRRMDNALCYKTYDGENWSSATALHSGIGECYGVEDFSGVLHIFYTKSSDIYYSTYDGSLVSLGKIVGDGNVGGCVAIIDENSHVRLFYHEYGDPGGTSYVKEMILVGAVWSDPATIGEIETANSRPSAFYSEKHGTRVAYVRASDSASVERILESSVWSNEEIITTGTWLAPSYYETLGGDLHIAYSRETDYYIVDRVLASSWGAESVLISYACYVPSFAQLDNGSILLAYYYGAWSDLYYRIIPRYSKIAPLDGMAGLKIGLMFSYSVSDTLAYTAGKVEVNSGGVSTLVSKIAGTLDVSFMFNGEWEFICITNEGVLSLETATGAATVRPSDTCFAWTGTGSYIDTGKHGYYFSATKRIIAAVHQVSSTSYYIINLGSESEEWGKNGNGIWHIDRGGEMLCRGASSVTASSTTSNFYGSSSGTSYYGNATVTYPVPFASVDSVLVTNNGSSCPASAQTITTTNFALQAFQPSSSTTSVSWATIGRYRA